MLTVRELKMTREEIDANMANIADSLLEMGIRATPQNKFYLMLLLVLQDREEGLTEAIILGNFVGVLAFVRDNYTLPQSK